MSRLQAALLLTCLFEGILVQVFCLIIYKFIIGISSICCQGGKIVGLVNKCTDGQLAIVPKSEAKLVIEELLMQESFSRQLYFFFYLFYIHFVLNLCEFDPEIVSKLNILTFKRLLLLNTLSNEMLQLRSLALQIYGITFAVSKKKSYL